jgi:voltage-dependent calcium channel L type alpha-1D
MDNPLNDPDSTLATTLIKINIVMTVFFVIEASVKIIAKGMFHNNMKTIEPYMSSGWNIIDIFVVCVSVFDIISMYMGIDGNLSALKALRALRALRPLRVINRFENLKIVVNCLFSTFSAMQNVLMVGSLLLLIFSIMGVSFFKGKFFSCVDSAGVLTAA